MMRAGPSIGLPSKTALKDEKTQINLLELRTSVLASNLAASNRDSGYEVQQVGYPEDIAVKTTEI